MTDRIDSELPENRADTGRVGHNYRDSDRRCSTTQRHTALRTDTRAYNTCTNIYTHSDIRHLRSVSTMLKDLAVFC